MHLYSAACPKLVLGGPNRPAVGFSVAPQGESSTVINDLYYKGIPFRIGKQAKADCIQIRPEDSCCWLTK